MITDILQDTKTRMQKSLTSLQTELAKIRTGRAHPSLLDQVIVAYYGSDVPLNQVANIAIADSRTLTVTPWEKDMMAPVEKAIMTSDLGLNPVTIGNVIRVPLPIITEERRKELIKVVRQSAESGKISVRNVRRDAINQFKESLKEKLITEDEEHKAVDDAQKITDEYTKKIDDLVLEKEKSLLEI